MKKIILSGLIAALTLVSLPSANAGIKKVQSTVIRTLIVGPTVADPERWGGCMAMLNVSSIPTCGSGGWVTFSCTGFYNAKDIAHRKYDSALMAFALGKEVKVELDNTKKHNGYCFVDRIDVLFGP